MRFRNSSALVLLLMAGCASDASGPGSAAAAALRGSSQTLISGKVFGMTAGPDSAVVPLRGAEIVVYRVDSIPVDTVPVDTVPVDTMLYGGLVLRPFVLDSGMRDTLPVDTIPVDTVPPDTNPPPPPPPPGCGRTGEVVARVLTRGGGRFRIAGLPQAKYDLRITPAAGSPFGETFYCGVHLLERHPVELTIYLPARRGVD
jgi:hypothetical protein